MTDYQNVYVKLVKDYLIIFEEDDSSIYILILWDSTQFVH